MFYLKRFIKYLIFIFSIKDFKEFNSFKENNNQPLSKNANSFLIKSCLIIKNLNLLYRLTDGTVLGIYRDNKLIPHDNDIDIDVLNTENVNYNKIIREFKKNNYRLGRIALYKNKIQQIVFYDKNNDLFDILFWYKEGEFIYNYSEKNYLRKQKITFFENLEKIEFLKQEFNIPSNIEVFLKERYGEDWFVPKTSKNDWKEECMDLYSLNEKND